MCNYNIFEYLSPVDEDNIIFQNEKRKALKKLREIVLLESKLHLTKDEMEKITMKQKWIDIVYDENKFHHIPSTPTIECKVKQQARHLLKEKKRLIEKRKQEKETERKQQEKKNMEKRKEEYEKKKKEQEELERKEQEENEKQEQEEYNKWKYQQEERERKEQHEYNKSTKEIPHIFHRIEKEFIDLLKVENKNIDRVFRILSLKYHPDKNNNTEDSIENQKILSNIRDKYLENQ